MFALCHIVHPVLKDSGAVEACGGIAVHLAVAGGLYGGVFLCCPFSHEMSG